MITLTHIKIYKKYNGDVDGFSRSAIAKERMVMQNGDWTRIESFIQDLVIIKKGLASETFEQTTNDALENECMNGQVIQELKEIADKSMDVSKYIEDAFILIESELSKRLKRQDFRLTDSKISKDDFGSRYSTWKNFDELMAVRLVWDAKESWLLIEESPFSLNKEPVSWADLVLVPIDRDKIDDQYLGKLVDDILNEIG